MRFWPHRRPGDELQRQLADENAGEGLPRTRCGDYLIRVIFNDCGTHLANESGEILNSTADEILGEKNLALGLRPMIHRHHAKYRTWAAYHVTAVAKNVP